MDSMQIIRQQMSFHHWIIHSTYSFKNIDSFRTKFVTVDLLRMSLDLFFYYYYF